MKSWIKTAIEHPGSFAAAAKKAGKTTEAFAQEHKDSKGTLGRRARLALTLMGMHHGQAKSEPTKSRADRRYVNTER